MDSEPTPNRRPIAAVRVSTVALVGIVAAIAVPAGSAALVMSGSIDSQTRQQDLRQPGPVSRVVVVDSDSTVRITGDAAVAGMTGRANLTWHAFRGGGDAQVTQQYANGVLTLTKDCGSCGADIDIHVPPAVSVQVTTSNAGVYVTNVSGGVDLHSTNGEIWATQLGDGDARMNTSNNSIHGSFVGAPKTIWAHTSNNSVTIITDGRTLYYNKISTSNGRTDEENHPDRFAADTIDVQTSNGDVTIK